MDRRWIIIIFRVLELAAQGKQEIPGPRAKQSSQWGHTLGRRNTCQEQRMKSYTEMVEAHGVRNAHCWPTEMDMMTPFGGGGQ